MPTHKHTLPRCSFCDAMQRDLQRAGVRVRRTGDRAVIYVDEAAEKELRRLRRIRALHNPGSPEWVRAHQRRRTRGVRAHARARSRSRRRTRG